MSMQLCANSQVKKARKEMWKHILINWVKLKFNHLPQECFSINSKGHLTGRITNVECDCGKCFYNERVWG